MIFTIIASFILFLSCALIEVSKPEIEVLSFGRFLTYSLLAIFLLGMTAFVLAEGILHPILIPLVIVSIAVLVQSYQPVKEGFDSGINNFKTWLKERKRTKKNEIK